MNESLSLVLGPTTGYRCSKSRYRTSRAAFPNKETRMLGLAEKLLTKAAETAWASFAEAKDKERQEEELRRLLMAEVEINLGILRRLDFGTADAGPADIRWSRVGACLRNSVHEAALTVALALRQPTEPSALGPMDGVEIEPEEEHGVAEELASTETALQYVVSRVSTFAALAELASAEPDLLRQVRWGTRLKNLLAVEESVHAALTARAVPRSLPLVAEPST